MTTIGLLHLVADFAHGLVEAEAGFDADDHQVEGVGEAEEDVVLTAALLKNQRTTSGR